MGARAAARAGVGTATAAAILKISKRRVLQLAIDVGSIDLIANFPNLDKLHGTIDDENHWRFHIDEVNRFKNHKRQVGRPKNKASGGDRHSLAGTEVSGGDS